MVKTIKYRKNISNATKHMCGGNTDTDIDKAIKSMISTLNWISRMYCNDTILAKFGRPAIKAFIEKVPDNETLNTSIKNLGINAKMKELIQTCLDTLKCKDIKTIITILPQLLAFDKIEEFLKTTDEATKKDTDIYRAIKIIVDDKNNEELICRIFANLKSKHGVTDEDIKKFNAFIDGDPQLCESIDLGEPDLPNAGSEQSEGSNPTFSERIKNMSSSFFGKQSNDNEENPYDKRCGENLNVKQSFFLGDYCVPKPAKQVEPSIIPEEAPPQTSPQTPIKGGKRQKCKRVNKSKKNKKSKSNKSKRSNK